MRNMVISAQSRRYLEVQRGAQSHLIGRQQEWDQAYADALQVDYSDVVARVPRPVHAMLDIGSGLGGVDVLLHRAYGCDVILLDGEDGDPLVERHGTPFCSRRAASSFMADNGVTAFEYQSPVTLAARPVDLVVSFASWCVHFPPELYLQHVLNCTRYGTNLIIDVRKERQDWGSVLGQHFEPLEIVRYGAKINRYWLRRYR